MADRTAAAAPVDLRRVADVDLPAALGRLQLARAVGEVVALRLRSGLLHTQLLADVMHGAGFGPPSSSGVIVLGERLRTLPDTVGPGMRLLLVSLNPSLYAADAGIGFARPGNRFWPAMLASGVATVDRDQWHLLAEHDIGMTELVKRATARADELTVGEYADGFARVERLVGWLQPQRVCFVGLDGWRKVVSRKAVTGWQERTIAATPTYVMPNPSGLNAHVQVPDLAAHLRAVTAP